MRTTAVFLIALTCAAAALAAPPRAHVAVRSTSLGSVLVDSRGHTLYIRDSGTCSGACLASWPPFLTSAKPVAVAGVPAARLGVTKRSDGKLQVTFMGHPLYFFASDQSAGDVRGASITHWFALTSAGKRLHAGGATATTPVTTTPDYGGGDGY